jgi:hypothetical protein
VPRLEAVKKPVQVAPKWMKIRLQKRLHIRSLLEVVAEADAIVRSHCKKT